jgi:hypothetical protein
MIVEFYLDEDKLYEYEMSAVPCVGDMVYFNEVFFVESLVWYPGIGKARVNLKDTPAKPVKVAEAKETTVNLNDVKQAKADSAKALKETAGLKRQLFSLRQYLRNNQERKT